MALKPYPLLIVMIISFFTGCSKSPKSAAEFTKSYAAALKSQVKEVEITQKAPLELEVARGDGPKISVLLNNAYDLYKASPKDEDSIIASYISGNIEILKSDKSYIRREFIVPVIKDTAWIREIQQFATQKEGQPMSQVTEQFCDGLSIVYAEDSPQSIKYFGESELKSINLDKSALRALAIENLKRNLPKIELHGGNGVYMMTAGGVYESSLLLLDSIWSTSGIKVDEDIVVCIPARDILLITGSNDSNGIQKVKTIAKQVVSESPYRLCDTLFIRKNGAFSPIPSAVP